MGQELGRSSLEGSMRRSVIQDGSKSSKISIVMNNLNGVYMMVVIVVLDTFKLRSFRMVQSLAVPITSNTSL